MAFTRVVGAGIHTAANINSHNIKSTGIITATKFDGPFDTLNVTGDVDFLGNVSIGGTLTYEDVTNIDSIGIVTARDGIFIPDNEKLELGNIAGSGDLQLYHTPSNSFIKNNTGTLNIQSDTVRLTDVALAHLYLKGTASATQLYHDNNVRLTTTDDGITVDKGITVNGEEGGDAQIRLRADQGDDNNDMFRFVVSDGGTGLKIQGYDGSFQTRLTVATDGKICIANNSVLHSGNLQVSTSGADAIDINSYSTNANSGGRLTFYRSKNASIGSNTIVVDDDSLGRIDFRGYNTSGNNYNQGATIEARVDGSVNSTTDMPTAIIFKTSGDGSANPDERLRITSAGQVQINRDGGSAALTLGAAQDFRLYHDTNGPTIFSDNNNQGLKLQIKELNLTEYTGVTTKLKIDSSYRILKGLTTARGNFANNTSGVEYGVQIEGTSAIAAGLSIIRNSNDENDGGIVLGKTRATSNGGNTVVQAGDDLGNITFAGSDGTTLQFGAEIFAEVQSGVGDDDLPTDLIFKTNPGSTSTLERLRIASNGAVCVGSGYKSGGGGHLTIRGGGINTYACQDYQYVGTPSNTNTLAQIRFTANTSGASVIQGAKIQAVADADWSATGDAPTRLEFHTAADGSASMGRKLWIDSNAAYLQGLNHTSLQVRSGSGNVYGILQTVQDVEVRLGCNTNHPLAIYAGTLERLRIHADGEVECKGGVAGQNALLVSGNYSTNNNVDIQTWQRIGGAVQAKMIYKDATTDLHFGSDTAHAFSLMTGGTDRLRIDSTGKVGIGLFSNFIYQLELKTNNHSLLRINNSGETGHGSHDALIVAGGNYYQNPVIGGANILFKTFNGSTFDERVRITSAGTLNIGGDYGQTTYMMKVTGSFAATTKSFVIDHPTKENHKLRYACLEGPENSVYIRGRSSDPVIELPDYWTGLVHEDSITVNVTPIGNHKVWVESINNNSVTIGSNGTEYFYTVFAERKDVDKLEVEVKK